MAQIQGIPPYAYNYDIRYQVATRVLIKDEWADSWQTVNFLAALSAEKQVSPGIGRAILQYRYGKILNAGETGYRFLSPQELDGKKVQIQTYASTGAAGRVLWTGIITSESDQIWGNDVASQSGVQTVAAYEVGHLLDRHGLEGAWFEETVGVAQVIGNMPDFNRPGRFGFSVLGNRSSAKINSSYVFSASNEVWTNRDIAEYLLAGHAPPGLDFRITGQDEALANITEVHRLEGMSLFKALDSIVDRHRGLGWNLISHGNGEVDFNVFTLLEQSISVGDSTTPANDNTIDNIYVAEDRGTQATVTYTSESQYDRVDVTGGKVKSCFTIRVSDLTLEPAWTTTEETAYKTPVSNDAEKNDAERQTDKHLRVYQTFRLKQDWNGLLGVYVATPTVRDDGTLDIGNPAKRFLANKSFNRSIPILSEAAIPGADPDYLPPIVALQNPARSDRYEQTETVGATLKMADSELAFSVSGQINHILGLNHFDPDDKKSAITPLYDYATMIATVSYDTDERLRVRAKSENFATVEEPKTLHIEVPEASAWYVVPGTVIGIDDGALETSVAGGLVRDDSDRLRQIAALALAWYGKRRAILDISWKRVTNPAVLGSLVRSVSDSYSRRISGTVITSVSWDFEAQETSIKTSFADLQFQKLLTRRDAELMRRDAIQVEKYLGNLPSRVKGGGAGTVTTNELIWNERTSGT